MTFTNHARARQVERGITDDAIRAAFLHGVQDWSYSTPTGVPIRAYWLPVERARGLAGHPGGDVGLRVILDARSLRVTTAFWEGVAPRGRAAS